MRESRNGARCAVVRRLALIASCLVSLNASARAESAGGLCDPPKLRVEKWVAVGPVGGMTISLPPSFRSASKASHSRGSMFFVGGRDRLVGVGTGVGPGARLGASSGEGTTSSLEKLPAGTSSDSYSPDSYSTARSDMNQTAQCTSTINGRGVQITEYEWSSSSPSPAGETSALYRSVAHFLATESQPDVFISIESGLQSDIGAFRQIFWTASFTSPATTGVGAAPTPACVATPNPNLPSLDAVLDTAIVQMLVANAEPPIPHGFEVMALRFNDAGGVAGISVSRSDLPDSTQRQLTTLVASNLKQHDSKAPSTFLLRVDAKNTGLRYSVQSDCTQ